MSDRYSRGQASAMVLKCKSRKVVDSFQTFKAHGLSGVSVGRAYRKVILCLLAKVVLCYYHLSDNYTINKVNP